MHANGVGRASIAGISLGGLIDTTPRYSDEIRGMWTVRARTAHTAGVAAMAPDLLKIWFSDACLARDPIGVFYVRETL